jgi:hypothetical protein
MNVNAPSKMDDMQQHLNQACTIGASRVGGPPPRRVNDRYRCAGQASRLDWRNGS